MVEHYRKKAMRGKMNELLDLLAKHERLQSGDLERMLRVTPPTLSNYTKKLLADGTIESYQLDDARKTFWRIKSERKPGIETQLSRFKAVKFLEGLDEPIYIHQETPDRKASVALFASLPNKSPRAAEKVLSLIVEGFARVLPRWIKAFAPGDKLALVVMIGGEEGVKP